MPGGSMIDPQLANTALAFAEIGYKAPQIAAMLPINERSIYDIINRHGRWGEIADRPVFTRLRAEQQRHIEAAARTLAAKALIQSEAALPKASAYQAAIIASIMIDKSRLLAGESTANIELHTTLELTGIDAIADLLSRRLVNSNANEQNAEIVQTNQTDTSLIK